MQGHTRAASYMPSTAAGGPWIGENIEPDHGYWVARQLMYEGAGSPPIKCDACKADPRAANCAGRTLFLAAAMELLAMELLAMELLLLAMERVMVRNCPRMIVREGRIIYTLAIWTWLLQGWWV